MPYSLNCLTCRLRHIIGQANSPKTNCWWRRCWIRFVSMASVHPYWIIQVNYLVTKWENLHAFGYRSINITSTFYTQTLHHIILTSSHHQILIYKHISLTHIHYTSHCPTTSRSRKAHVPCIPEQYHFICCMPPENPIIRKSSVNCIASISISFHVNHTITNKPAPKKKFNTDERISCCCCFFSGEPIPNAQWFIRKEKFFKTNRFTKPF